MSRKNSLYFIHQSFVLPLFLVFLSGCADAPVTKVSDSQSVVDSEIQKSSNDVYGELKLLNATNINADYGFRPSVTLPSPVSGCSLHEVSIDYDGDASRFIDDLKSSGFCAVRVVGKQPPQNLLISLHHHHVPLWHVVEDFGVQIGSQARVIVTATDIEVRYHGQVADIYGHDKHAN